MWKPAEILQKSATKRLVGKYIDFMNLGAHHVCTYNATYVLKRTFNDVGLVNSRHFLEPISYTEDIPLSTKFLAKPPIPGLIAGFYRSYASKEAVTL